MAIKDWKRIYPKNIKVSGMIWERKDNDDDEIHLFSVTIVPSPNKWRVVTQHNRELTSKKDFKIKTHALKYAKVYMRKH